MFVATKVNNTVDYFPNVYYSVFTITSHLPFLHLRQHWWPWTTWPVCR